MKTEIWERNSLASPTRIRILLHFAREQGMHPRRAAAQESVPGQQRLDGHGGREQDPADGEAR